ncbi:transposase [Nocardiopsis sp. CNT312]|uniref:transposase n=1 Tax=Nocardiopsis sp. CNT312 TaxID=1137268 RepID=UPI00048D0D56|nr:transposase [Nocardiopsis sp. CNT312]
MLPHATAPPTLQRLLTHFWPCFTRPTFTTFAALITGLITRTGPRTVCGMLTGSGLARTRPHDRAHTFFSRHRWNPHHPGQIMARLIVDLCTTPGQDLTLAGTLIKRSVRHVRHHDGARPAREHDLDFQAHVHRGAVRGAADPTGWVGDPARPTRLQRSETGHPRADRRVRGLRPHRRHRWSGDGRRRHSKNHESRGGAEPCAGSKVNHPWSR